MFEYLDHTADIKIRVKAKDEFEFYSDIVNAIRESIFEKDYAVYPKKKTFIVDAKSIDLLIHDFIEELLYLAYEEKFLFKLSKISIEKKKDKYSLICSLVTKESNPKDYSIEVKAVSFNIIYKENDKSKEKVCEFILDI